jgi:DNA polymerase III psi subunit
MSISHRQFIILQEMGIALWQQKETPTIEVLPSTLDVNIKILSQHTFFNDVILGLGLSLGEISCDKNQISLGLLNWQFRNQSNISIDSNMLTTPEIKTIQQSPQLKAQLWRQLQEYTLT